MRRLEQVKTVLEILLLLVFLGLLVHIWRSSGKDHALGLLTNKP